jgi:cytochrome c oxidase cbb3-type subunit 3
MSQNSPDTEPVLRPHEYDGIQEYDQKLPNWWLFSWYIMMVAFVVCWVVYYQVGIGMSDEKEIATAMAKIADYQKKELEQISDDKLWAMSKDAKVVAAGRRKTPRLAPQRSGVETWESSNAVTDHHPQRCS